MQISETIEWLTQRPHSHEHKTPWKCALISIDSLPITVELRRNGIKTGEHSCSPTVLRLFQKTLISYENGREGERARESETDKRSQYKTHSIAGAHRSIHTLGHAYRQSHPCCLRKKPIVKAVVFVVFVLT